MREVEIEDIVVGWLDTWDYGVRSNEALALAYFLHELLVNRSRYD